MSLWHEDSWISLHQGHVLDCLRELPDESVHCIVTSPPYWGLRRYEGQQDMVWDGKEECEHQWDGAIKAGEGYTSSKRWQHGHSRESAPEAWNSEVKSGGMHVGSRQGHSQGSTYIWDRL